tara:strand:+ start:283 stop:486 length:204 start_codon:yes stop_codon:yes gene_type:complete
MPTPFHCHSCDKPTMNNDGVCNSCKEKRSDKADCLDCGNPCLSNEYYCDVCKQEPKHYEEAEGMMFI